MYRSTTFILIVLLFSFILTCAPSGDGTGNNIEKKIIKLSHSHQADFSSEIHMTAWIFQKWIDDHSNTLQVKIYASNALGQEREVYEGMQLGAGASCIISGTAILSNFAPKIGVLDLSFLWKDFNHVHQTLDGPVGALFAQDLEKSGFKVLAWLDSWGYRNVVTASKKIESARDLQGLKIRTIQSATNIAALNAMGANATPMAFGEVYTGMQTGVLDGFEHNATVVKANKFYEVAKYMAITRHLFGPLVFIFSKKLWERFSDKEQKVILDAATMARDVQRSLAPLREKEALNFLKDKGLIIQEIDRTPLIQNAEKLHNELAEKYGASDLLQKIKDVK
jgi:tripartite ATP-independent transporter DctP family solute receptor